MKKKTHLTEMVSSAIDHFLDFMIILWLDEIISIVLRDFSMTKQLGYSIDYQMVYFMGINHFQFKYSLYIDCFVHIFLLQANKFSIKIFYW